MKEKYYKWEPVKGIEKEMWVEAIHDDYEGLRILLKGSTISSIMLSVNFSHYYMYCNVDESYRIKLWDANNLMEIGVLGTHESEVKDLDFSPDGRYVASASLDGLVKLWDIENKKLLTAYDTDYRYQVSQNTSYIVAGNDPGSKYTTAQKLGVKILNEKEFLKML